MVHPVISLSGTLAVALIFLAIAPARIIANDDESVSFTYGGSHGPSFWGKLNPNYTTCSQGKLQSPININRNQTFIDKKLKPLVREYRPVNATLVTNGVTVGVHFENDCGEMNINNESYVFKQMHWHSPSEHTIDGVKYPLELHLVHQLANGSFSVIGILFDYGEPDPYISKLQKGLDKLAEEVKAGNKEAKVPIGPFDVRLLKRSSRRFFRYIGSLTTPPCTENVIWNIIPKVRTISKEQVQALKAPLKPEYKDNCRPVQSLNGRTIEIAPRIH